MPFTYHRTVHFRDTDAAGVVYFANVLAICHEAYEASLAASGVDLKAFFRGSEVAIPIVHASVDFLKPMFCGEQQAIVMSPKNLSSSEFEITYELFLQNADSSRQTAQAKTRHVCINPAQRARIDLPDFMEQWLHQWRL